MVDVPVLNNKFEASDKIKSPVKLGPEEINIPVVHQVVKAILANRRQGNACTKTRGNVRGGGAKPFKQKGTGRARQGSTRSPIMVGGGTAFGPSPRSYDQKVNKKAMKCAIHSVLADKYQAGKLTVLEELPTDGKTSAMYKLLNDRGLFPALIVSAKKDSLALRATRNLQYAKAQSVCGFSVYEAVRAENLVIEKEALENLLKRLV